MPSHRRRNDGAPRLRTGGQVSVKFGLAASLGVLVLFAGTQLVSCNDTPDDQRSLVLTEQFLRDFQQRYPMLSPFEAVAWNGSAPLVTIDGTSYELLAIDDLSAPLVIDFCKQAYGKKWRMRFSEDLVQVLTELREDSDEVAPKIEPGTHASLRLRTLDGEGDVVRSAEWTEENRARIRRNQQGKDEGDDAKRPAVAFLDPADNSRSNPEFLRCLEGYLEQLEEKYGFSGVVAVRQGDVVVAHTVGLVGPSASEAPTLDTRFRIASLSKQFTAAAVLWLASKDRLSVDDEVARYIPAFEAHAGLTIDHLLHHASGLPRLGTDAKTWARMARKRTPLSAYVDLAVSAELVNRPGERFEYSNLGYRVLSAVVESVVGEDYKDYATFMEKAVFAPLKLRATGVAGLGGDRGVAITTGMHYDGRRWRADDSGRNYGTGYGSGGIYTSANDLLRWDSILSGDEFLPSAQRTALFEPLHESYACGWQVKVSGLDGNLYQSHGGRSSGFSSEMMRIPETGRVIVVLCNVRTSGNDGLDKGIGQLLRLGRSLAYEPVD